MEGPPEPRAPPAPVAGGDPRTGREYLNGFDFGPGALGAGAC